MDVASDVAGYCAGCVVRVGRDRCDWRHAAWAVCSHSTNYIAIRLRLTAKLVSAYSNLSRQVSEQRRQIAGAFNGIRLQH